MRKIFLSVFMIMGFASCSDKEPAVSALNKEHSIEVTLETKQLNSTSVLLITRQNVYVKGSMVKSILRTDTIPSLGDSLQTIESGDTQTRTAIPKEYEFFVTVK
jgi:hypothetical protein